LVCKAKKGGLGVLYLRTQNEALLLENLDKFFKRKEVPWVQLVCEKHYNNGRLPTGTKRLFLVERDILKLLIKFKGRW
jgi:hypothetical protein